MYDHEPIYVLGEREELELDPCQLKLHRDGQPVVVEPKVLDVLHYLIKHRNRIVPSEELFAAFWPPHISSTVLAHSVVVARRALGDTFERQQYIRTVRGRGYRFVGRAREHSSRLPSKPVPAAPTPPSVDPSGDRLLACYEQANGGASRVVVLTGARGIGKTFRLQQLGALAESRGAVVLTGRCHEGSRAPALWPWRQVLRAASEKLRQPIMLLPERYTDEHGRFQVFEAITRQLERAAQDVTLVLVLDDLEWADEASLELLRFAAYELSRNARILLACACRDERTAFDEPLALLLEALAREPAYERIAVTALSAERTAELVAQVSGTSSPELARRAHELTAGHPFFIHQLAADPRARRELLGSESALAPALPEGIRSAIGHTLRDISDHARVALDVAAVIGRDTSPALLEQVLSWPTARVLEALDEVASARILCRTKAPLGRYTFAQPLVRIAIYEAIPLALRVRLHAAVARSLERALGTGSDMQREIAYHLYQAAPGGQADKALSCLFKVAAESLERSAYEESAECYQRALELLALEPQRDAALECQAQLGLGWLKNVVGERATARASFKCAATIAERAESLTALRGPRDTTPERGPLRAIVLAQLANLGRLVHPIEERRALSAEAVSLAERSGDAAVLASALMSCAWSLAGPDHADERLHVTERLFGMADLIQSEQLAWAHVCRYAVFFGRAELERADGEMERFAAFSEASGTPATRWLVRCWHAQRALSGGNLTEAETLIEEARLEGDQSHQRIGQLVHAAQRGNLCYQRGRLDLLSLAFKPIGRVHPSIERIAKPMRIFWSAEQGALEAARSELEAIDVRELERCPRDELWMAAMWAYASASARCGATEHAAVLYEILMPRASCIAFDEGPLSHFGPIATVLSALALVLGKRAEAGRYAVIAQDVAERLGGIHALLARLQRARVNVAFGRRADMAQARALASSVEHEANALGMAHVAQTAAALARACKPAS